MLSERDREVVIRVRELEVGFGERLILDHLDLDVYRGEILGFVGGSGQGKSVLTRTILGLLPKRAGSIEVFGEDLDSLYTVCDRIAALSRGRIIATGTVETMLASDDPWLKAYFHGKRARAVTDGVSLR